MSIINVVGYFYVAFVAAFVPYWFATSTDLSSALSGFALIGAAILWIWGFILDPMASGSVA